MSVHYLLTDPVPFVDVLECRKRFEIRATHDRVFAIGDNIVLQETEYSSAEMDEGKPRRLTGRTVAVTITHVMHGPIYGLMEGWAILSIKKVCR